MALDAAAVLNSSEGHAARAGLIEEAGATLDRAGRPGAFVRDLYGRVPPDDLAPYDPQALAGLAGDAYDRLKRPRRPGSPPEPRLIDVTVARAGRPTDLTLVEIVNDNRRFLLDSTLMGLAAEGLAPLLVAHPILGIERDDEGLLRSVFGETTAEARGGIVRESLIHIHLDRIDDGLGTGGNMGTLLTLRDMESAAQLGQELEVARRLAAIGKLTAGVGHEVKNPINAMVLHLELLRGKLIPAGTEAFGGAQRHVDILAGEMQRLDRVVQTLADFSRPMELHLKEQDLRQVVSRVMDLTMAEMEENRVQARFEVPKEPVMVRIDAELIQQALLNLLLNGMQAMPEGGELVMRIRRDHQVAVVEVSDQGEGILPELLPRIFELYFTTKPKGSGIGLAMTYRILQLHGGAMDVRSNAEASAPARGTTFTFRLPVATGSGVETRKTAVTGASSKGLGEEA